MRADLDALGHAGSPRPVTPSPTLSKPEPSARDFARFVMSHASCHRSTPHQIALLLAPESNG